MGYRSDVAVAMRKEDFVRLKAAYQAKADTDPDFDQGVSAAFSKRLSKDPQKADCRQYLEASPGTGMREVKDKYVILSWSWWKWYTEFADVQFVMDFVQQLENYQYIRIGEDLTDIEYESSADFDLIYPDIRIGTNTD